jgi:hypothetical protein
MRTMPQPGTLFHMPSLPTHHPTPSSERRALRKYVPGLLETGFTVPGVHYKIKCLMSFYLTLLKVSGTMEPT